jgi:hypothetical protein
MSFSLLPNWQQGKPVYPPDYLGLTPLAKIQLSLPSSIHDFSGGYYLVSDDSVCNQIVYARLPTVKKSLNSGQPWNVFEVPKSKGKILCFKLGGEADDLLAVVTLSVSSF